MRRDRTAAPEAGAMAAAGEPLTALALFGAAALAAELLEEPENARLREPLGPGVFRVASGVDVAAVIVLAPGAVPWSRGRPPSSPV